MKDNIEKFEELSEYQRQVFISRLGTGFIDLYETKMKPLEEELAQGLRDDPTAFYVSVYYSPVVSDEAKERLNDLILLKNNSEELVKLAPENQSYKDMLAKHEKDVYDHAYSCGLKMLYNMFWSGFNSAIAELTEDKNG